MEHLKSAVGILLGIALMTAVCSSGAAEAAAPETKELRILATSDLHGKFMPWDYALNEASSSGSMAQLASAVALYRTGNTLLVDAGDTIQDNAADIFISPDRVHPMVKALNALNYDIWVTGNHEYNYGMDTVKKTIADIGAKALAGNVYGEDGKPIADGWTILDRDGVRVAVIGMVTPLISRWDEANLAQCTVTDSLEETRRIIDEIRGQYDVLIGVFHMGIHNEYNTANTGVADILNACPEFDVMVSSHEHALIPSMDINGVLVVQNKNMAQTMSVIDLTLEKTETGWRVAEKKAESVDIGGYEADPAMAELLKADDEYARADAEIPVARLEGGALAPENEIREIPSAQIMDTALIDLINQTQLYYSGAKVSAAALLTADANLYPGKIRKCDMSQIYKFANTLYRLRMTGAQLKQYMEWSVSYYNTYRPGDLTISFNPDIRAYMYDMFDGVQYEVDIASESGSRIRNLTWPDGTPVTDEEEFDIVVNNYRASAFLLNPGVVYAEGEELPKLTETDIHGEIGGIREMIREYIIDVKGGVLTPECDDNWRIVGNDWDEELHRKAVELLKTGVLAIPSSEDGRTPAVRAITEEGVIGK